ncbi:uncharacterized protein G2W53_004494 [Senna tora]|uniref:Uncharacterized protein n=1 Tax=Senna tora TaxID=362788 RepID=A0A834XDH8_9FABA|nr:uncharacterized protein G2W53_004494 [Senna tora]
MATTIPISQNPSTSTMVFMPTPTVRAPALSITQPIAPTLVRAPLLSPASMYHALTYRPPLALQKEKSSNETIQATSYAPRSRLTFYLGNLFWQSSG